MPNRRKVVLAKGEIYHIFNRAIANQQVFVGRRELSRAINLVDYYRFPQTLSFSKYKTLPLEIKGQYTFKFRKSQPLIEIYSFSFMPTHYHFLIKQLSDKGTSIFASKFQNGFAKYFNKKNDRDGGLFRRPFKAKRVATDEEFTHVSRYIHLNPVTSYIIEPKELATYPWTSLPFYLHNRTKSDLISTKKLLDLFGSSEKYKRFVLNQADYQRTLDHIKKLL